MQVGSLREPLDQWQNVHAPAHDFEFCVCGYGTRWVVSIIG
jgi:hypothetical protein